LTMRIAGPTSCGSKRQPLFHSPDRLIVGNAPLVGILDLPGTRRRPPIRLFFPSIVDIGAKNIAEPKPAGYFVDGRVSYLLQGFAHVAIAGHATRFHRWILRPFLWLLSLVLPARYLKIPGTVQLKSRNRNDASAVKYAPPSLLAMTDGSRREGGGEANAESKRRRQRLVVFSHGLTGTGEENSIYCTALAKRGYVVASIHHRDGSSCRVPMPDGSCQYYRHMPTGEDYDPNHRLEQVRARAEEFLYCCTWLVEKGAGDDGPPDDDDQHPVIDDIRQHLDERNIIASGFSYGAATASLAATLEPDRFLCAILLDGWFHIDYSSRGVEFDFPPESFGMARPRTEPSADAGVEATNSKTKGLNVPSLFVNSAQFRSYKKLYGATRRLAGRINASCGEDENGNEMAEMHVLPGTTHSNFCDVVFWLPRRLAGKVFRLGDADAYEAHKSILEWTARFLERF